MVLVWKRMAKGVNRRWVPQGVFPTCFPFSESRCGEVVLWFFVKAPAFIQGRCHARRIGAKGMVFEVGSRRPDGYLPRYAF